MTPDADFDNLGDAFEADVYGTTKGYVRLAVLWEDLLSAVPAIRDGGLSVLDAGGGSGHMACRLAKLGNAVVLCDPSGKMLRTAEDRAREEGVADRVRLLRASIDDLPERLPETFDLITCHAVLEWLAEPEHAVKRLAAFLRPEGLLSLMFYNRNAAVLKRVLHGDFDSALYEAPQQDEKPTPLDPDTVAGWLRDARLRIVSRAGIRIFHDHIAGSLAQPALDRLLEVEKAMRRREPFASLAQHVHLVCRLAGDGEPAGDLKVAPTRPFDA